MNYNDKNYKPQSTYPKFDIKSLCRRKQIMCEYANVSGRCIYTQCVKKTNNTEYFNKTYFKRWLDGDTE